MSSPRACGLGAAGFLNAVDTTVQPTRMRAWGADVHRRSVIRRPAHAHAGLGLTICSPVTPNRSSPRACGLGADGLRSSVKADVQPTRMWAF